ncbi:hypothetical protein [Nocardia brasiliensis]|uniref:hypothetical protein n=1 Tax=Nocardia brasiliensis TaxID=37326 RepID=UPI00114C9688|nr:hypothetical protein [Nocardia brasiliensis]
MTTMLVREPRCIGDLPYVGGVLNCSATLVLGVIEAAADSVVTLLYCGRQPSAVSRQPSAVSRQPSAVSRQPSAVSRGAPTATRRSLAGQVITR